MVSPEGKGQALKGAKMRCVGSLNRRKGRESSAPKTDMGAIATKRRGIRTETDGADKGGGRMERKGGGVDLKNKKEFAPREEHVANGTGAFVRAKKEQKDPHRRNWRSHHSVGM